MEVAHYIFNCPNLFLWSLVIGFGLALGFFACKLITSTVGAMVLAYFKKLKK